MTQRTLATRFRVIFAVTAAMVALLAGAQRMSAQTIEGKFYEYKAMAVTGQTPLNANSPLSSMSGPSINQNGVVAFAAGLNSGGQGVVAASPTLSPTMISFANPAPGRFFGPSVQINSAGQVLAQDTDGGDYFDRLWYVAKPGSKTTLVSGGRGYAYSAVDANGSVNASGDAVVPALDLSDNPLILSIQGGNNVVGKLSLPAGSFPLPQIADNGTILVRLGQNATSPVYLYNQTLTTQIFDVADSSCFSVIGNAPGISSDGMVVAFYGVPNDGLLCPSQLASTTPGIFAAVNTGSGWSFVRVTGIAAELGYDDNSNPIQFSSYASGSRVAVVNLGLAPVPPCSGTGIAGNSFVVSFVGTPSSASRTNPVVGNGVPLLFSNQQGLWTIRVDVGCQLGAPSNMAIHPRTAIPVVQVNDRLGAYVISQIEVFNQLANAAQEDTGVFRTMRRGDHRVVFWAQTTTGQQLIVRGSHLDSDQDGLLDHWEMYGIDMDQDGIIDLDLPAMGADPNKRDLFLQIDWLLDPSGMVNFQPWPGVVSPPQGDVLECGPPPLSPLSPLEYMFCGAPSLTGNMYGVAFGGGTPAAIPGGITLHVDGGPGMDIAGKPFSTNMCSTTCPVNDPTLLAGGNQIAVNASGGPCLPPQTTCFLPELVYFGVPNSLQAPVLSTALQTLKDAYFGYNDKDGRELAFHYALFADYIDIERAGKDSPQAWQGNITQYTPISIQNCPPYSSGTCATITSGAPLPQYPPQTVVGGTVEVVSGSGIGEHANIVAVNGLSLTVYSHAPWSAAPSNGDSFVILAAFDGKGEMVPTADPDASTLPGNDLLLGEGAFGVYGWIGVGVLDPPNNILWNPTAQWRTLAHELGHNLGLRHGGTSLSDAYNGGSSPPQGPYPSLMSYTFLIAADVDVQVYPCDASTGCFQSGDTKSSYTCPSGQTCSTWQNPQSYSGVPISEPISGSIFDDWSNLQLDFIDNALAFGNSLLLGFNSVPVSDQQPPEPTALDYVNANGPPSATPPVIQIQKPAANAKVGLGLPLGVTVSATSAAQVAHVSAAFDVNGDGNTTDPGELVQAKLTSGSIYKASFAALSGPLGPRMVTVSAIDSFGDYATVTETVNVAQPNPVPSLTSLSPSSATHGSPGFTLTVNGSNVLSGAVGKWNGASRSTTFVNSGQVTMKISAADIAAAGTAQVTVINPGPGGGTSNALTFTIN